MILLHQPAVTQCLYPVESIPTGTLTTHSLCSHCPSSEEGSLIGSVIIISQLRFSPICPTHHTLFFILKNRSSFCHSSAQKPPGAPCCPPLCHLPSSPLHKIVPNIRLSKLILQCPLLCSSLLFPIFHCLLLRFPITFLPLCLPVRVLPPPHHQIHTG